MITFPSNAFIRHNASRIIPWPGPRTERGAGTEQCQTRNTIPHQIIAARRHASILASVLKAKLGDYPMWHRGRRSAEGKLSSEFCFHRMSDGQYDHCFEMSKATRYPTSIHPCMSERSVVQIGRQRTEAASATSQSMVRLESNLRLRILRVIQPIKTLSLVPSNQMS